MRAWVGFAVAVVLLSGCYKRRNIVVPPSEHSEFCIQDAQLSWRVCYLEQRGHLWCDERRDRMLLACDGAYELTDATIPDGGLPTETTTYELPGFKP